MRSRKIIAILFISVIFTPIIIDNIGDFTLTFSQVYKKNNNLKASVPELKLLWNKTSDKDSLYSLRVDSSDNLYGTSGGQLYKLDPSGVILWNLTTSEKRSHLLCLDTSENIYVGGTIYDISDTGSIIGRDAWLSRFSNNGTKLWNITWYTPGDDYWNEIATDSNDDVYIWGEYEADGINPEYRLIKFDNQGNYLWNQTWRYPILRYYPYGANAIYIDHLDNIYVAASSRDYSYGVAAFHLYKFNTSGGQIWDVKWETPYSFSREYDIICDSIGNIYAAGGRYQLFLLKYNNSGVLQMETTSTPTNFYGTIAIELDDTGNIYCGGTIRNEINLYYYYDIGLWMYDSAGNFQCSYQWGSYSTRDLPISMVLDSSYGLYLSGYSQLNLESDYFLLKFKIPSMFEVLYPNSDQVFGKTPPSFEIRKFSSGIDSTWYSLNHTGKYIFSEENGIINKSAWDSFETGEVLISFYANNTLSTIQTEEVTVYKDLIAPNLTILNPIPYRLYGNVSPTFNILVDSPDLGEIWYTVDNGINNYTFNGNSGFIDQTAWNNCNNGTVDIIFYVNDVVSNEASETIQVYKDLSVPCIKINTPEASKLYGKSLDYNLEIFGDNIDEMWYTLNDGQKNFIFSENGTISGSVWEDCADGLVEIKFFINDTISKETFTEIFVNQDTTDPEILVLQPVEYKFYSDTPPAFNLLISDVNLNSTWYTLDGGVTNFTMLAHSGIIDFNAWNSSEDGNITIKFYVNDSVNNINSKEIIVIKDTIRPSITIERPFLNELFLNTIPNFNVSISDPNLNNTWYTLNGGQHYYFTGTTGSISQQLWDSCTDGYVNITFYANDFAGNLNFDSITVRKNLDSREAYAIIVGISNYPGSANDLNYCDEDALGIYNMLINDFNYKPENIIYIQDSGATKAAISNAFDTIASISDPNDIFFFYYSGHGGQNTYTTQGTWNVETLHPYWNNYDQIWSVSHPGAIAMRVHFTQFQTEPIYDYLLLGGWSVTQGYYYEELTGNLGTNFWSSYIPVSRTYIRFISDSSNSFPYYGFKIDKYEVIMSDGTHFLSSYDSIPNNPSNNYIDTLLDSKLDNLECEEKYVIADSCNSGGLIPEVQDIGRYIMTACRGNEESLETISLEHGIFTYYLLEAKENANDVNDDGVISMEEVYNYVYSHTVSESGSYGSEYHPEESDGINGESVFYPSLGGITYETKDNILNYSFFVYGNGILKTLNITVISLNPVINYYNFDLKYSGTSTTGFGLYQGSLKIDEGFTAGGFQILAEIEGYKIINVNLTIGDSDGDGLTDFFEVIDGDGLDPTSNDTDSDGLNDYDEYYGPTDPLNNDTDADGLLDGEEVNTFGTDPLLDDTDSDGLNDYVEINTHFTNPLNDDTDSDNLSDGDEINTHFTNPLNNDTDSDNLLDSVEVYTYNTNPLSNDTDSDLLLDFAEIFIYNTNPLNNDTDSDGLSDYDEIMLHNTDPLNSDSDSDGLSDYEELNTHNTDPINVDTDSDTIPDGWEVNNLLDPLTNDTALDPDNDLLSNLGEYQLNTQPFNNDTDSDGLLDGEEVFVYFTEPLLEDTDFDGLFDGEEVNTYNTNPLQEDTDSDGLSDGEEVNIHNTDPLSEDTDSDTMHDKWEVDNLLNPLVNDTTLDPDNDLLMNVLEYQHGTNPQDPDTDNDNWTDGDEVLVYDTDPLDPDDHPRPAQGIPGYSFGFVIFISAIFMSVWIIRYKKKLFKS